jgi:hypothetical protein
MQPLTGGDDQTLVTLNEGRVGLRIARHPAAQENVIGIVVHATSVFHVMLVI